jgi:hypothetical protein
MAFVRQREAFLVVAALDHFGLSVAIQSKLFSSTRRFRWLQSENVVELASELESIKIRVLVPPGEWGNLTPARGMPGR